MLGRAASQGAGGDVVYTRGAYSVTIAATFGSTEFQVDTGDGVRIEHSDRDFIVTASALILNSVVALPAKGDTVTVGGETYEVLAPGGAQVYRRCDPAGTLIRIHTKRVAA